MRNTFFATLLTFLPVLLLAQTVTISGRAVSDEGKGMSFASIVALNPTDSSQLAGAYNRFTWPLRASGAAQWTR